MIYSILWIWECRHDMQFQPQPDTASYSYIMYVVSIVTKGVGSHIQPYWNTNQVLLVMRWTEFGLMFIDYCICFLVVINSTSLEVEAVYGSLYAVYNKRHNVCTNINLIERLFSVKFRTGKIRIVAWIFSFSQPKSKPKRTWDSSGT